MWSDESIYDLLHASYRQNNRVWVSDGAKVPAVESWDGQALAKNPVWVIIDEQLCFFPSYMWYRPKLLWMESTAMKTSFQKKDLMLLLMPSTGWPQAHRWVSFGKKDGGKSGLSDLHAVVLTFPQSPCDPAVVLRKLSWVLGEGCLTREQSRFESNRNPMEHRATKA